LANKKRQQTINKRNRERAIEEKRTLKRQRRQEKAEAIRNGEPWPPVAPPDPFAPPEEGEQQDGVEGEIAAPIEGAEQQAPQPTAAGEPTPPDEGEPQPPTADAE
jgi:hypothetical protein